MIEETDNLPVSVDEKLSSKKTIEAGAELKGIIPRNPDEAWFLAGAIVRAGLVPSSYEAKGSNAEEATRSRVMIGIMKGMEVGLPPITALSTIMIVNNRPAIWGDGLAALIHGSGKLEYIKEWTEGAWEDKTFVAWCEVKRRDQSEPVTRFFGHKDALKAGLLSKAGPWTLYPTRQARFRASGWAYRDAFADVLMGLISAEEAMDMQAEERRNRKTDVSDLEPAGTESVEAVVNQLEQKGEQP